MYNIESKYPFNLLINFDNVQLFQCFALFINSCIIRNKFHRRRVSLCQFHHTIIGFDSLLFYWQDLVFSFDFWFVYKLKYCGLYCLSLIIGFFGNLIYSETYSLLAFVLWVDLTVRVFAVNWSIFALLAVYLLDWFELCFLIEP